MKDTVHVINYLYRGNKGNRIYFNQLHYYITVTGSDQTLHDNFSKETHFDINILEINLFQNVRPSILLYCRCELSSF